MPASSGAEPHHQTRIAEWLRGELQSAYHLVEEAATPTRNAQLAIVTDPLEDLGEAMLNRDFTRIAQLQPARFAIRVLQAGAGRPSAGEEPLSSAGGW